MARFSEMLGQFQLSMSNRALSAESEVPGLTPLSDQSPPLRRPVCTDVHPRQFQGTAEGPVPSGLGFAQLSMSGELSARSGIGSGSVQAKHSLLEDAEVAQTPAASGRPKLCLLLLRITAWSSSRNPQALFMHDDYPAIHQGSGLLFQSSYTDWVGTSSIFSCWLSG